MARLRTRCSPDTLQGLSDLPEIIEEPIRSSLEDEALVHGLKWRLDIMNERLTRFRTRYEKKRELACWVMEPASVNKLEAVDFAVSLCEGGQRLEVSDSCRIPAAFLVPQPPKIDRIALVAALKCGEQVEGACLVTGTRFIAVRCR